MSTTPNIEMEECLPVFSFSVLRQEPTEAVSMALGVNRDGLKLSDVVKDYFAINITHMSSLYDRIVYSLESEHKVSVPNDDGSYDMFPIMYSLKIVSTSEKIEGSLSYCPEYLHDLDIITIEKMMVAVAKYVEKHIANFNPLKGISKSLSDGGDEPAIYEAPSMGLGSFTILN